MSFALSSSSINIPPSFRFVVDTVLVFSTLPLLESNWDYLLFRGSLFIILQLIGLVAKVKGLVGQCLYATRYCRSDMLDGFTMR